MSKKHTACYDIKACWHTISRMYNSHGFDHDISISTGYVLLNLSLTKGTPSTQIAPQLGMEARSLTRLLKSLETKGLIKKQTDNIDKRQVNIYLTEHGNSKRKIALKIVKNFNSILESKIDNQNFQTFKKVLNQIISITEQNFKIK